MSEVVTGWRMPAETVAQARVWMGFPPVGPTAGENADDIAEARRAWAAVAHAIAEFQPVTMLVDPADEDIAPRYVSAAVERVTVPLDDAWLRDIGPSFVLDDDGALGAVNWRFNGWGRREWARWERDDRVASTIARLAGAARIDSDLVNEGGGIAVDGAGTVLLTDTVQRDPRRNPRLSRADVEAEMARTLGADHAIWLARGLHRDAERFGTFGHVDIVAALASPECVVVHDQRDPGHPDHAISRETKRVFESAATAAGGAWRIAALPAPRRLRDAHGFVDYSYINHLPINGAVIVGTFDDPADAEARSILAELYPGRRIVGVDARAIFARGGGVHCITQQQPRSTQAQVGACCRFIRRRAGGRPNVFELSQDKAQRAYGSHSTVARCNARLRPINN
ncbi:agmatine deiminase family protein [Salinisphaera sp.]|uniref:agmatine deiminase family protein n=1 Tax=Salinisphaera sp. TaxID=1914330 RepID=UPI002D785E1F|nr:agmatine deiminase family protein [Salinisphaera sp.]HET7313939.1 agmatine deiminase family protein [Salinisphaera sp.]